MITVSEARSRSYAHPMQRVQAIVRAASDAGTPIKRYIVADTPPGWPAKMGYRSGKCDGCDVDVLINEGFVDDPRDAGAVVLLLCDECTKIHDAYRQSLNPPGDW